MRSPHLRPLLLSVGLIGLSTLCAATDAAARAPFLGEGPQLELRDLIARVIITPENRSDIEIRVRYGKAKVPTLMVSKRGNTTVLNGHIKVPDQDRNFNFRLNVGNLPDQGTVVIPGMGAVNLNDLPLVFARVPMAAAVKDSAYSFGHIGPSGALDFVMNGTGEWLVDPVSGPLSVISTGSGDIRLTTAADTIIDNMGSGDISIEVVRKLQASLTGSGNFSVERSGDAQIDNHGSGDVNLGSARNLTVRLNGSGDAALGNVTGGLTIDNNGSSDIHIVKVIGPVSVDMTGSGDISIDSGDVPTFALVGSGSGDVNFGGTAGSVTIDSNGSSDINIRKATGPVNSKINGSGEANIGH